MKHAQINVIGTNEQVVGKTSLYLSCSRQSEVPDMQQLSMEIIIEHDLLLHFNTKERCICFNTLLKFVHTTVISLPRSIINQVPYEH